jgi:arsenate reductase (thioredoxin)
MTTRKQQVLILCTHNSARSQMAEALLNSIAGGRIEAYSAGSTPGRVNPFAIEAMSEIGIDITTARSKHLNEFLDGGIDVVITVCDDANESCPVFPGNPRRIHWSFPDPSAATGTQAERLAAFREIRDGLGEAFEAWLEKDQSALTPGPSPNAGRGV